MTIFGSTRSITAVQMVITPHCKSRWLLKPNGVIAVSEVSCLQPNPPDEVRDFWTAAYPTIQDIAGNIRTIEESGYEVIAQFTLPKADWWTDYYIPIAARLSAMRKTYQANPKALEVIEEETKEIHLFRRYSDWYG